jgi:hypothetical protein
MCYAVRVGLVLLPVRGPESHYIVSLMSVKFIILAVIILNWWLWFIPDYPFGKVKGMLMQLGEGPTVSMQIDVTISLLYLQNMQYL